jgi:hypothetical protein
MREASLSRLKRLRRQSVRWLAEPKRRRTALNLVVVLCALNFLWAAAEVGPIGRQYEEAGRAFLWIRDTGVWIEVAPAYFHWLQFHLLTAVVSFLVVWIALVRRALMAFAARQPASAAVREAAVRASGPVLLSALAVGRFPSQPLKTFTTLRVTVHPGGLIIKPLGMPASVIRVGEIFLVAKTGWFWGVDVFHGEVDLPSPVHLRSRLLYPALLKLSIEAGSGEQAFPITGDGSPPRPASRRL